MILEVNIINKKASVASINRAEGFGGQSEPLSGGFREQIPLRKILGSKDHLERLKIYLKVAEIITVI